MKLRLQLTKDLSAPDPIPTAGIERVQKLMESGRLHRYGEEAKGDELDVLALEREYADYMGVKYCVALNSCGCGLFIALKCVGVQPHDKVLLNAFTLAPVPGAIAHCNADPVLVEVDENYVIDLTDLRHKAELHNTKVLLISHMRGHIADMDALVALCDELGVTIVEDCAHSMSATWDGRLTGMFGKVAVFSTQTFKQLNSGEGGLLVTNDEDIAAQAILYSGSYMLHHQHGARPDEAVFERWKGRIPNFSMRMTNFAAAVLRPQLALLAERTEIWNRRYTQLAKRLAEVPQVCLPHRPVKEGFVASSIQFTVQGLTVEQMQMFQTTCIERGVLLKWFGNREAIGFTSSHHNWKYLAATQDMPQTDALLHRLFDMRIPLSLTDEDVEAIATIIFEVMCEVINLSPY